MNPNDPENFCRPCRPTKVLFSQQKEEDSPAEKLYQRLYPNSGVDIKGDCYLIQDENVYEKEGSGIETNKGKFVGQLNEKGLLGEGVSSKVTKFEFNGFFMAVKDVGLDKVQLIPKHPTDEPLYIRELEVIKNCRECPQIVDYYGYMITGEKLSIYMELMDASVLRLLELRLAVANLNAGFPEPILSKLTLEVVKGLYYIKIEHKRIHRDVHLGNILLDCRGNIKVCDLGIAGKLNEKSLMDTFNMGCLEYLAPERLREGANNQNPYGAPADVWSLGIVLVHLARGTNPHVENVNDGILNRMIRRIETNPPRLEQSDGFSVELCKFVENCLQVDQLERPKFDAILEDPFVLKGNDVNKDFVAKWVNEQLNLGR